MKFFVKDFCEIVEAGIDILCMQDDNDVLYCGIANQPFVAYSSQHLPNFLSFHTLKNEIFLQRFCKTVQARVVIFGMLVDNDVLYHGNVNQPSHSFFSLDLSDFFLSILSIMKIFLSKISVKPCNYIWYEG